MNLINLAHGLIHGRGLKLEPPRDKCKTCGKQIPPGRPGRDCKSCRDFIIAEYPNDFQKGNPLGDLLINQECILIEPPEPAQDPEVPIIPTARISTPPPEPAQNPEISTPHQN